MNLTSESNVTEDYYIFIYIYIWVYNVVPEGLHLEELNLKERHYRLNRFFPFSFFWAYLLL